MDPWDPWDPRNSVKEAEMKLSKGEVLGFREIQRVARSYLYILDHTCTIYSRYIAYHCMMIHLDTI